MVDYARLKAKNIDLEGRSRRNNLRIIGLPESIEGPRPTAFYSEVLVKMRPGVANSPGAGPGPSHISRKTSTSGQAQTHDCLFSPTSNQRAGNP
ncbi:hypothetical protein NHX12_008525 [Muraenolepis orangiensis]|uniref:Uncharacterized protein n=1 Tax=Muraenolepis orangiensis TaxID=630683 RepID=A0A9Q0D3V8_9TELE|nr:hypothetical protein NHX12_016725 [Muraenolepis orangiensis]KAJ3590575.1 hypothetical protein NHX12_008525 [Muraenolepis orangiensis]